MAGSGTSGRLPPSYSQLFPEPRSLRSPSPVRQCNSPVQRLQTPTLDPFQGGVYCAPSPPPAIARQLQQEYLIVDRNTTREVESPVQTFVRQFALAIFTCLCCGVCFGLLALLLVGLAQCQARRSPAWARRLARTSTVCSIIGIVLVFVLAALYFGIVIGLYSDRDIHSDWDWKNGTFDDNMEMVGQRLAEKWFDEKCRDVFFYMSPHERRTVTDTRTLELLRMCDDHHRSTTRRSITSFY